MEKAIFRLGWVSEDSIIPFFLGCIVFVMSKNRFRQTWADELAVTLTGRKGICQFATAFCYSFFTCLGYLRELYVGSPLRILFDLATTFMGLFFLFMIFISYAYDLMGSAWYRRRKDDKKHPAGPVSLKNLLIYTAVIFICYIPLFLRFYPGSFGADSINQIRQAMHLTPYTNHLPVLSTWLIELFYDLGFSATGNVNAALAFYTVFQMLITACTYAFCVCYLQSRGTGKLFSFIILAVFALTPMITMYAIYIHKDTPAADLLLLLIIFLHFIVTLDRGDEKKTGRVTAALFMILSILFMLFRSNHFYVYAGLLVCAAFAIKNLRKTVLILMCICILISALFKGPVLKSMDIQGADAAETLSMPLVMISYTLSAGGDVSDRERSVIEKIISCDRLAESYSLTSANPVKRAVRYEGDLAYLTEHKGEFMSVFISVFMKNPAACTIALVDHSKGYYCPKFTYPELILGTWENEFGAFTDQKLPDPLGQKVYELTQLAYDKYEKYLGCAMSFWLILFLMFYAIYRKKSFLPYMPPVGIVATFLLASPNVGRFRYQYPVMVAAILLTGLTFLSDEKL